MTEEIKALPDECLSAADYGETQDMPYTADVLRRAPQSLRTSREEVLEERLKRLLGAIEEYRLEYDNPVPDYVLRRGYRKTVFTEAEAARAALSGAPVTSGREEVLEEAAKVCDRRMALRWERHAITESDTNASYYPKSHAWCEVADEEAEETAAAIRALKGTS